LDEVSVSARVSPSRSPEAKAILDDVVTRIEKLSKQSGLDSATMPRTEKSVDKHSGNLFLFKGHFWQLCYQGVEVHSKDTKGMKYLSRILTPPRCEQSPSELLRIDNKAASKTQSSSDNKDHTITTHFGESWQKTLDEQALKSIKEMRVELYQEIADAKKEQNFEKMEMAKMELESINERWRKDTFKGKAITISSTAEKNRKTVWIAIRRAIELIRDVHPKLATHLTLFIHYDDGGFRYTPESKTIWTVR
jgi:hypothetical protein